MAKNFMGAAIAARTARRLLARLDWAAEPDDEESEAARDEAQRLLLARHLARPRKRTETKMGERA